MPFVKAKILTCSFFGTAAAGSEQILVSKRIGYPFKTSIIVCSFPTGTNRLLNLQFFVSPDSTDPLAGRCSGSNILESLGNVDYITGDSEQKTFSHEIVYTETPNWLKIRAVNNDFFDHTVDVQWTIIPIE